jgi:hypothetical protein
MGSSFDGLELVADGGVADAVPFPLKVPRSGYLSLRHLEVSRHILAVLEWTPAQPAKTPRMQEIQGNRPVCLFLSRPNIKLATSSRVKDTPAPLISST